MTDTRVWSRVLMRHLLLVVLLVSTASSHASLECSELAEQGNCDFYKCLERVHPCGERGYVLGYGYRYCDRFTIHFHRLTLQGQRWMDAVRKCLMRELLTYFVATGDKTCENIKSFAFLSHPQCYTSSGPGFCTIITDPRNYDALYRGYQLKDFVGDDWKVVWRQVQQTAMQCGGRVAQGFIDTVEGLYNSGVQRWRSLFA